MKKNLFMLFLILSGCSGVHINNNNLVLINYVSFLIDTENPVLMEEMSDAPCVYEVERGVLKSLTTNMEETILEISDGLIRVKITDGSNVYYIDNQGVLLKNDKLFVPERDRLNSFIKVLDEVCFQNFESGTIWIEETN